MSTIADILQRSNNLGLVLHTWYKVQRKKKSFGFISSNRLDCSFAAIIWPIKIIEADSHVDLLAFPDWCGFGGVLLGLHVYLNPRMQDGSHIAHVEHIPEALHHGLQAFVHAIYLSVTGGCDLTWHLSTVWLLCFRFKETLLREPCSNRKVKLLKRRKGQAKKKES